MPSHFSHLEQRVSRALSIGLCSLLPYTNGCAAEEAFREARQRRLAHEQQNAGQEKQALGLVTDIVKYGAPNLGSFIVADAASDFLYNDATRDAIQAAQSKQSRDITTLKTQNAQSLSSDQKIYTTFFPYDEQKKAYGKLEETTIFHERETMNVHATKFPKGTLLNIIVKREDGSIYFIENKKMEEYSTIWSVPLPEQDVPLVSYIIGVEYEGKPLPDKTIKVYVKNEPSRNFLQRSLHEIRRQLEDVQKKLTQPRIQIGIYDPAKNSWTDCAEFTEGATAYIGMFNFPEGTKLSLRVRDSAILMPPCPAVVINGWAYWKFPLPQQKQAQKTYIAEVETSHPQHQLKKAEIIVKDDPH